MCDFDFSTLIDLKHNEQAHLILVNNPQHNLIGDFALVDNMIHNTGDIMFTYSGIGIYSAEFFAQQQPGVVPLAPIIRSKCEEGLVSGQYYAGSWSDVGTIERLQELEEKLF